MYIFTYPRCGFANDTIAQQLLYRRPLYLFARNMKFSVSSIIYLKSFAQIFGKLADERPMTYSWMTRGIGTMRNERSHGCFTPFLIQPRCSRVY